MPGSAAAATFYLRGSIRRGDGADLTCKMREHMLTLNLCKKEGNDQESIQSSITSSTGQNTKHK